MTAVSYSAQAYSPDHGETKLSGELTVTATAVHFQSPDAQVTLPLQGLHIKLGGASNRLVFFEHPQIRDWVVYSSDRTVLANPHLASHPEARDQVNEARGARMVGWGIFAFLLTLFVALPLWLVSNLDRASAWVAPSIPADWEHKLGETVFAQYKLSNTLLDDAEANRALAQLTGDLIQAAHSERYSFTLHINTDSELNAFALPDGTVVLNAGLILAADHADEVLGVLAHEVSHVRHQHGVRQIISSSGIYLIVSALIGDASGVMAVVASASPMLLSQSYSRYFETEADAEGAKLMTQIHGDIGGLVSFFEKMQALEEKRLAEITDENAREALKATANLLGTHPATEDRISALKALAARHYSRDPNREDAFQALKARVAELVSKADDAKPDADPESENQSAATESQTELAR
ncbi:M48 family metallopeptidase [Permianibacter sp. IMCC34836]|uniref:M48 family metallopeptidase n=1 Tax=Permianibacter fluminis TaxID=2738515 RepID=UPI00155784D9|nr:M48 family metallopeptidase [Permianibacter fluminis]NQD35681.1 M48 family metallopeptidase [Permianibacter fluminis]